MLGLLIGILAVISILGLVYREYFKEDKKGKSETKMDEPESPQEPNREADIPALPSDAQPLFFPVSTIKLFLMSTCTLGLYELYWFYKNWQLIQKRTGRQISPFWRAFFGVLFVYPCFKEMTTEMKARGIAFPGSPGMLALIWILLTVTWRLPEPYSSICFLAPLMLLPVQMAVNRLNRVAAPNHDPNYRFSGWNVTVVIIGGFLFLLAEIGLLFIKQ